MRADRSRCATPDHFLLFGMYEISERLVAVPYGLLHLVHSVHSHVRSFRRAIESVQGTLLEVDGRIVEDDMDSRTLRPINRK